MTRDLESRVREILSEPELVESLCLELARRAQSGAGRYVETARAYSEDPLAALIRDTFDDGGALLEALTRDLESEAGA